MKYLPFSPEEKDAEQNRTTFLMLAIAGVMIAGQFFLAKAPTTTSEAHAELSTQPSTPNEADNTHSEKEGTEARTINDATMPQPIKAAEQTYALKVPVETAPTQTNKALKGGLALTFSSHGGQLSRVGLDGYTVDRTTEQTKKESREANERDTAQKSPHNAALEHTLPQQNADSSRVIELARAHVKGAGLLAISPKIGSLTLAADSDYARVASSKRNEVRYKHVGANFTVERVYTAQPGSFQLNHDVIITNTGTSATPVELDVYMNAAKRNGPKEKKTSFFLGGGSKKFQAFCVGEEDDETYDASDLEDETQTLKDNIEFAAIGWHYFSAAYIPTAGISPSACTAFNIEAADTQHAVSGPNIDSKNANGIALKTSYATQSLAPGESQTYSATLYLGPKQLQTLQSVHPRLESILDFGFVAVLSKPLLMVLVKIYDVVGNFGIAIILLTLLIKLVTFPLTQKQYASGQKMRELQPQVKALKEKFEHDPMLLMQKQQALFKENGVSQAAGCLPALIQMPIWFALYRMIWSAVELYQQPFAGWITDLSQTEIFPLIGIPIMPFVVGLLSFFQMRMTPMPDGNPQMKMMMNIMPVMFAGILFTLPSGLAVYWTTNTLLTMVQQLYIRRKFA